MHISTTLLLEYEEVARREAAALWARPERVEAVLNFVAAIAQEHAISFRWRPFLADRDDDFILELAVAAGAKYIITHDLRDFAGAESFGIVALRPGDFLKLLNATTP